MNVKRHWPIALIVIAALVDILLTLKDVEYPHSVRWLVHNPGSTLYPLALLPMSMVFLTKAWYSEGYRSISRDNKWVAIGLPAVLAIAFGAFGVSDLERNFESGRTLKPTEIKSGTEPGDLMQIDFLHLELQLRTEDIAPGVSGESKKARYHNLVEREFPTYEDYKPRRTRSALWGVLLNAIAGLCGGVLIGVVLASAFCDKGVDGRAGRELTDLLLLAWITGVTWPPLRLWSEYYSEFGEPLASHYDALIVGSVLFLLLLCVLGVRRIRSYTAATIGALASGLAIMVIMWKPDVIVPLAKLSNGSTLLVQVVSTLMFAAILRTVADRAEGGPTGQ